MTPENPLPAIEAKLESLSRAHRRVAERTLREPDSIAHTTLAEFAEQCGVSEPTVIRFCREIGYSGFREFKLRVTAGLATRFRYADIALTMQSNAEEYTAKAVDASLGALLRLRSGLDPKEVEVAVDTLTRARRIEFYGVGASGIVALDAQHKFFRFSTPTNAERDTHMQRLAAAALSEGDVVVAFSHTGRTRSLIETVQAAGRSGATTIAVTSGGSPLAKACDHVVAVAATENTDLYTPMVSRLAHLVIVDVLALGVAVRGGAETSSRLLRVKDALALERLPPGESEA